ncbi:hypothetical protein MNBD_UNCLBAC01-1523 [hydrothermal vent metagenome]|uniref:Sulfatase-modifying factor enzyme-like domain-containing protein n=1 Tax=hydrothermal vent metagenome TaxID=652676 RepID=A0A3B1DFR9_9ZZZZ
MKIKNKFLKIILMFSFLIISKDVFANNLSITNFAVYSTDIASNQITFTSDVSWNNAWRNTINYDAVWVFMKYSTDAGVTWKHASMSTSGTNPDGFNIPSNFEIIVPSDKKGFFLQKTDLNSGDVTSTGLRFIWDYGQDGLSDITAMAANTVNKIFGVEMVYIPQGAFYAGDGASSSGFRFKQGSADDDPWYIQNENAITTTSGAGDGYYYQNTGASGENATNSVFLIPSSFPKGYQASYVMKYELTEGQWVSFFNTLSSLAKSNRDITGVSQGAKNSDGIVNRNTVSWDSSNMFSDASSSRVDRPVSYISWPDLLAYADWAALRPITEFEYEKAARGKDVTSVVDEYAWGTTSSNVVGASEITPDSDENGTEKISDGAANLNRNTLSWSSGDGRSGGVAEAQKGPLRAGIFATNATTRISSGAGYYGNMELSGNLHEMIVTVGRAQGRQFLGTHGDGSLATLSGYEGNATNIDWPGINTTDSSRGVTGTVGSGYRGGDFQSTSLRYFQISTRTYAAKDPDSEGYAQRYDATLGIFQGGRLGRSTP